MEGFWYTEAEGGRRFLVKIAPGESLRRRLADWAGAAGVKRAVLVSAVGSLRDLEFRGIKTGAKLPLTPARLQVHKVEGPLELLALSGNVMPGAEGAPDCHLHVMASRASGEVVGGHLFDGTVFANCEIVLTEIVAEGVSRHTSATGGVETMFIPDRQP